jgi:hypothetical protein
MKIRTYHIILICWIILVLWCIFGSACTTLKKATTKTDTNTDTGQVTKTDSSGTKSTAETYTKETHTIYRDSLVIIEGKPYPVYVPTQTIIKEQGARNVEEAAQVNNTDSGWMKVIAAMETRTKEKTGIPFTTIIIFGLLGICAFALFGIIIYLKVKP